MMIRNATSQACLLRLRIGALAPNPRTQISARSLQQSRHSSWWSWLSGSKNEDPSATSSTARTAKTLGQQDVAQSAAQPPPQQTPTASQSPPRPSKTEMAERDRAIFEALDNREGGGAGNEIVDGQFEKGMTKNTRANQYRVI